MSDLPVQVYYQATMPLLRGYKPGDTLVLVVKGTVGSDSDPLALCDWLWTALNADERPWGDRVRSMSMGDVVVVGEVAYSCETLGWKRVGLRAEDCHRGPFAPMQLGLLIPRTLKHHR